MAKQGVGNTALGAATCRLIEQYQPDGTRLFSDPLVKDMLGAPIRLLMGLTPMRNYTIQQTDAAAPGIYGAQICRTRYIDDAAQAALSQGIRQLVILGAGLDTRPYRLPGIGQVTVFEVDLPSVQNEKKKQIQKHFGQLPKNVSFVPIDFDTQALEAVFAGSAFDPSQPAVFIWEGVTQYISAEAVLKTLAFIGQSAPGSLLIFTYVLKSVIERRSSIDGADKIMDRVSKGNAPWVFGLEPADVPAFLQPFHLKLITDVGSADYQAKYLKPLGRDLVVSEMERVVQAVITRP